MVSTAGTHAASNAACHLSDIVSLHRAFLFFEEQLSGDDMSMEELIELQSEGWDGSNRDEMRDRIYSRVHSDCLSLEYSSGWYVPTAEPVPQQFRIILTFGGPSLWLLGSCDEDGAPDGQEIELSYYEMGMSDRACLALPDDAHREALLWFASVVAT